MKEAIRFDGVTCNIFRNGEKCYVIAKPPGKPAYCYEENDPILSAYHSTEALILEDIPEDVIPENMVVVEKDYC